MAGAARQIFVECLAEGRLWTSSPTFLHVGTTNQAPPPVPEGVEGDGEGAEGEGKGTGGDGKESRPSTAQPLTPNTGAPPTNHIPALSIFRVYSEYIRPHGIAVLVRNVGVG